jgi:hypothetical protein
LSTNGIFQTSWVTPLPLSMPTQKLRFVNNKREKSRKVLPPGSHPGGSTLYCKKLLHSIFQHKIRSKDRQLNRTWSQPVPGRVEHTSTACRRLCTAVHRGYNGACLRLMNHVNYENGGHHATGSAGHGRNHRSQDITTSAGGPTLLCNSLVTSATLDSRAEMLICVACVAHRSGRKQLFPCFVVWPSTCSRGTPTPYGRQGLVTRGTAWRTQRVQHVSLYHAYYSIGSD